VVGVAACWFGGAAVNAQHSADIDAWVPFVCPECGSEFRTTLAHVVCPDCRTLTRVIPPELGQS
jgi:rubrerythrin